MKFVEWAEQYFYGTTMLCRLSVADAIKVQREKAKKHGAGFEYSDDTTALEDFKAVNWAIEIENEKD